MSPAASSERVRETWGDGARDIEGETVRERRNVLLRLSHFVPFFSLKSSLKQGAAFPGTLWGSRQQESPAPVYSLPTSVGGKLHS